MESGSSLERLSDFEFCAVTPKEKAADINYVYNVRGCLRKTKVNRKCKCYPTALKDLSGFRLLKRRTYPMSKLSESLSDVLQEADWPGVRVARGVKGMVLLDTTKYRCE